MLKKGFIFQNILDKVGEFSPSEEKIKLFTSLTWENTIELMLIFAGIYARHQESSNNEYQRQSYSGQKKVPLCKPFTIYTTTRRVLDIAGPFNMNQNDAEIIKKSY